MCMDDREKLIEILRKPIFLHELADPTEAVADYLLDNGVTFAPDINNCRKWISVNNCLPKPGVVVLVYSKLGCTYFSHRLYNHVEGKPFCIEYSGGWEVTHWMPLPKPPMEE